MYKNFLIWYPGQYSSPCIKILKFRIVGIEERRVNGKPWERYLMWTELKVSLNQQEVKVNRYFQRNTVLSPIILIIYSNINKYILKLYFYGYITIICDKISTILCSLPSL